jgi:uncharacterized protein YndB with AHSA1/START domain
MNATMFAAAALLSASASAGADVIESADAGMRIKTTMTIQAPKERVYAALLDIGKWWSAEHTFSGDPKNLTLEAKPGGCFCEALPQGGGVRHMTVVFVAPNQRLILSGALGPLQTGGLSGAMTIVLSGKEAATELTLTYNVGGYFPGGLTKIAPDVDGVLRTQISRLKSVAETGKP